MTDFVTFLYNNVKPSIYTGGGVHSLYYYLRITESPTNLTSSGQRFHHIGTSSSTNNNKLYLTPEIVNICVRQNIVFKCCGIMGHKSDSCIYFGPKLLPPSLGIKINPFNDLHCDELTELPREYNIQTIAVHFNSTPLLQITVLWFQLSWGDSTTTSFIMAV